MNRRLTTSRAISPPATNPTPSVVLQRSSLGPESVSQVPPIVHDVLNAPGQPLDTSTRAFMEPRFRHDFSGVRVHTDQRAAESARSVNAAAYTVGQNIVFTNQMFRPGESGGRHLLAHELAHVVQQSRGPSHGALSIGAHDSPLEAEADHTAARVMSNQPPASSQATSSTPLLSRRDPDAVGHIMTLGTVAHSGIQFFPRNVTDTQIGMVTARGGLISEGMDRLSVIIGENLTPRMLARELLPLWNSAIEAIPAGASPAVVTARTPLTEEEMAQGLMSYNQQFLTVPAMNNWRAGLNFPLPAEIDTTNGMTTVNHLQIRALASGFDPAWTPLLDMQAPSIVASTAASLTAEVTAFLGRVTAQDMRGLHLATRSATNPIEALPYVREVFRQLAPADGRQVAFGFIEYIMAPAVERLANQADGSRILVAVLSAIDASPTPALTATEKAQYDRVDNAVTFGTSTAAPAAVGTQPEKSVTVDTVKLDGSSHNPATDVQVASAIFSQCNVRVQHGVNATATPAETTGWLGGNTDLKSSLICGTPTTEETKLVQGATTRFGMSARLRAFFPATFSGISASGYSCTPGGAVAAVRRNMMVIQNSGDTDSLAHELGHILINLDAHTTSGLMSPRPSTGFRVDQISDAHCKKLYKNA